MTQRLVLLIGLWLLVPFPSSMAQVSPSQSATFHVPLPHIEAYVLMYQGFFEGVKLESEKDEGIAYLDETSREVYESAEEFFNRSRPKYIYDKTPDSEMEWLALAIYYLSDYRYKDDFQKAEEAAKKALEFDKESFEAYAILFYIYDWNKEMGDSSAVLRKLESIAQTPKHYGVLGSIYMPHKTNPVGSWEKSEYYFNKALEGDPDYALAYEEMAWYYYYIAEDSAMAMHYIKKYLELRPEDQVAKKSRQTYSSVYPLHGKRDPFVLVMAGLGVIFVLNLVRIAWKRRKSKKAS